jgi:hypothetical protein
MSVKMHYAPSEKNVRHRQNSAAMRAFSTHTIWIKFLADRFEAIRMQSLDLIRSFLRTLITTFSKESPFR